jgi:hypothetical protein
MHAMNKASRGLIVGLAICGSIALSLVTQFAGNAFAAGHAYVGESQCEDCHGPKEALKNIIGPSGQPTNPVAVWQQDPHHKSFESLTSDWGKQAASKAKVDDPQAEGSMCLKCHATGTGAEGAPDPSEGVSCEACHGAAADWVKKSVHGEIGNDPAKMATAVAAGMLDVRKMDVREKNCKGCHITDRPCYRPSEKPFDVHNDKKFKHWRENIPVI